MQGPESNVTGIKRRVTISHLIPFPSAAGAGGYLILVEAVVAIAALAAL